MATKTNPTTPVEISNIQNIISENQNVSLKENADYEFFKTFV